MMEHFQLLGRYLLSGLQKAPDAEILRAGARQLVQNA